MEHLTSIVRRCVEDYNMIAQGDTIAVGISGGKDSLTLLCTLAKLRSFYPKRFQLHAITLSLGFEGMDFSGVRELCRELDVPYTIKDTDIKSVVFDQRRESNPCSLCAKMRRGALHDAMLELGIKKIALGHHFDDAIETFFLSLFYEGRLSCFQPVTYMSRTGITQIRPLLYVGEGTIRNFAERYDLPVVANPCPEDGKSRREDVKVLIRELTEKYPDLRNKVFGAMQRLPLEGWQPRPRELRHKDRED
ncbi:MAG: adenine nucleotide alpha hydrolase family protein [Oscillospiraceae bacterium]|nr:adenine nucleotide alpha hydrolase family protein [Oscillospiraceae bacterium]